MRCVVQRVKSADVRVTDADGATREVGRIGAGLVVLAGLAKADTQRELAWMSEKIANLRIFEDAQGRMNLSVRDTGGGVLVVPNFTVVGDAGKGRRPSFDGAMAPEQASGVFDAFVALVRAAAGAGVAVATGEFRAMMAVTLVNDGPVTIVVESPGA